ncbi:pantetheine-phosphate adenylyltransferase [Corynebacterium sp. 13CS0277]|uniref:pantetheine-phosphate adenylyltransferase n=1 Tax=Corynebacterium sp. 13CS0277 TaxID=2071994 RepID=UPI000D036657|nr:pantetheine-phosphate adenylyltransferase [Corynebacterium sp. 13CS0277]PRQ11205.1 pantetheine-phosphate adenylyltransferase [Corynebacterium sp. 13CS0277]
MRVVCPGSFDPVTMGHLDVFERAAAQFDEVTVLVTHNPNKQGMFTIEERLELISGATAHLPNVTCDSWSGLLVDYTTAHGVTALIKGLRSGLDYEYELPMAQMNKRLSGLDTFFLLTDPKYGYISSTLCKEVARYGGDVSGILPDNVVQAIAAKLRG